MSNEGTVGNTRGRAAITSDDSNNLLTVIKEFKKLDGRDSAGFKPWAKKFCVVVGATQKTFTLKKQRKPNPVDTSSAFQSYTRANEDLHATLFLLSEQPTPIDVRKLEDEAGISADGKAA